MPRNEKISARRPAEAFRYLAGKAGDARVRGCGHGDIKNVLVINSASRSGSSFLYRLLSSLPGVIALNGEDTLFQKLHGLFGLESSLSSDEFPPGAEARRSAVEGAAMDMLLDSGREWRPGRPFPAEDYAGDCARRFLLQWPCAGTDPDRVLALASAAVGSELSRGTAFDHLRCWADFLAAAAGLWPEVEPGRYDLPGAAGAAGASGNGPPGGTLLEEPPFVVPVPRVFPEKDEAFGMTLLLKSSSNCYRAELLKRFFPAARYRFILLARNPMGAVNGLLDGWLSRGFFSRDVGDILPLSIDGYSSPEKPWSRRWWKFDLPPGWSAYAGKPLAEVCAFQWTAANSRILRDSAAGVFGESLPLRYEDLLDAAGLKRSVAGAAGFAGLASGGPDPAAAAGKPVMSVIPPRRGKWLARRAALLPLLSGPAAEISAALGYDPKEIEKWP
jgi:hypothetical protein